MNSDTLQPPSWIRNNILISAHGNSLRALVMFIEKLSPEEILQKEISTGQPITYAFEENSFKEIQSP